jgi:nucleoside-diphosphate-sugar epimerase
MKKKRILITGGAGYIGSMLSTELVNLGHTVTVVDTLKYSSNSINHLFYYKNFIFLKEDVTKINVIKKIIKKQDYIIPLAGLVGAPLCEKFKKEAIRVNFQAVKDLLKFAKKNQKIIYPTTNSGYGVGQRNKYCDENSPLNPISLYGRTKTDAEKLILKHKNCVAFRLATVFGYSYRMRTDLLVNNFVEKTIKDKKIEIFEPNFRRNFVHIKDVVAAFIFAIENFRKIKDQVYNLGLSSANITKLQLAKKIKKQYRTLKIVIKKNQQDPDKRDYFVSNRKIEKKGFAAKVSLDDGIRELIYILENTKFDFKNNY